MASTSSTPLATRIVLIFIALLFFVTASAYTIYVIYEAAHQNNGANSSQATQTQANSQAGTKLANFTPVDSVPELKVTDTTPGTGAELTSVNQTITADYSGAVASNGVVFDSSKGGQPLTIPLSQLIPGWQKGMIGMKVGGERRMLIPADQAYGVNPPQGSGIPANAPLVFDVTLKQVK